ncbi:hypothetical protein GA0061096_1592 [Fictibacillus enclensis]|uniref:Uncharacterized protein n=1 Tax=Fictibacillus enclensis TaxID=1017270 RepID=A0A0V8JE78_9BACL|nr:hypothetical protein [Fictibacillus enclensis]KSU85358.1 hypothetical protein AS030_07590 [Fictibacillus enclensis]SCB95485.1 hypothetical protein GA0061096_1592 [Fictibacillus enclensis]
MVIRNSRIGSSFFSETTMPLAMQNQQRAAGSASALLGLLPFILGGAAAPLVGLSPGILNYPSLLLLRYLTLTKGISKKA